MHYGQFTKVKQLSMILIAISTVTTLSSIEPELKCLKISHRNLKCAGKVCEPHFIER